MAKYFSTLILISITHLGINAQANLSLWISEDSYHDHSAHGDHMKSYPCDSSYYLYYTHSPDQVELVLKNEGNALLIIDSISIQQIAGASFDIGDEFPVSLDSDEMYAITVEYQLPVEYVDGINGRIKIYSNDPNGICQLSFDVGSIEPTAYQMEIESDRENTGGLIITTDNPISIMVNKDIYSDNLMANRDVSVGGTVFINDQYSLPSTIGSVGQVLQIGDFNSLGWADLSGGAFENHLGVVRSTGNYDVDDFVFGASSLPETNVFTSDTLLFFDKSKGSLRVGSIISSLNYMPDSIGDFSFGSGRNIKAKGLASVAMGNRSIADGDYAAAFGNVSTAVGDNSFAAGSYNSATGESSMAIGNFNVSSGIFSSSLGSNNSATGRAALATGESTLAEGDYSVSFGNSTIAKGRYSTAMGYDTDAEGEGSTSIGVHSFADGYGATAIGYGARSSGEGSTALGSSYATGDQSIAMGYESYAEGDMSTAMGFATLALGMHSTTMGYNSIAHGVSTTAIGESSIANAFGSTVIGVSNISNGFSSTVIGMYNDSIVENLALSYDYVPTAESPLFIIGNGNGNTDRSNAMVVRKDGSATMGSSLTLTPQVATSGGDSELFLTENRDAIFGIKMKYDGVDNELQFIGKNSTSFSNPHMVISRDDTRVGIGDNHAEFEFNVEGDTRTSGFTQLGNTAPKIRMKQFTGTTAATAGNTIDVFMGVDADKVLSIDCIVETGNGLYYPPNKDAGYEYRVYANAGNRVYLGHTTSNSVHVINMPYKILITYQE